MRLLPLSENALFVRFWRPQSRQGRMLPLVIFYGGLVVAVIVSCYFCSRLYLYEDRAWATWPDIAFKLIAALESLVLLVIGSYSVGARANSEVETGTLDFHRASPTPLADQVVGLVLGPPALEWICFALGVPGLLLCGALGSLSLLTSLGVIVSLMFTALFFHLISAAVGLSVKKAANSKVSQQGGAIGVIILLIGFTIGWAWAPVTLPAFFGSMPVVLDAFAINREALRSAFFGLNLPPLLTQVIVQTPLMAMAALGVRRAIRYPERPALSKRIALALAGWLFILFTAAIVQPGASGWRDPDERAFPVLAMLFAMLVGACLLHAATPRYALYCGGLRRRLEGLLPRGQFLDDAAGNGLWALLFMAITLAFYAAVWIARGRKELLWMPPAAMALYFGWLAQSLEYFRLRPGQSKGSVFPLMLGALWVILPIIGVVASSAVGRGTSGAAWLMSACPVFGILLQAFIRSPGGESIRLSGPLIVFGVNFVLFLLFAVLAHDARRSIAKRIESGRKAS